MPDDKVLRCDCGHEARAADDDGLVEEIRRHAHVAHGMELSPDDALVLVFRAELSQQRPSALAGRKAGNQEEGA